MDVRMAHLVGSLPGDTPEEAMRTALQVLGTAAAHTPRRRDRASDATG